MNCIIIDDDPFSVMALAQLIKKSGKLKLEGEFSNVADAIPFIESSNKLDIIFLDIEMPGMDGFQFIQQHEIEPQIIIVSSNQNHAVEAFEFNVIDFFVKPVQFDRLLKSIQRVNEQHLLSKKAKLKHSSGELYVKKDGRLIQIREENILYVEALADYATVHCVNNEKYTILSTMKSIEQKLPSQDFARVHRSFIVRLDKIKEIRDDSILIEDTLLPISRSQKAAFLKSLNLL